MHETPLVVVRGSGDFWTLIGEGIVLAIPRFARLMGPQQRSCAGFITSYRIELIVTLAVAGRSYCHLDKLYSFEHLNCP